MDDDERICDECKYRKCNKQRGVCLLCIEGSNWAPEDHEIEKGGENA